MVLLSFVTFLGCNSSGDVFGHSREEFLQLIVEGEVQLRDLELDDESLHSALASLASGDAYYLSYLLAREGLDNAARVALRHEANHGDEPYRLQALRRLSGLLRQESDWSSLRELLKEFQGAYPRDQDLYIAYGEALYRLERDRELRDYIDTVKNRTPGFLEDLDSRVSSETALWEAVIALRAENPRAPELVRRLFLYFPAGPVHSRVYLYLVARPQLLAAFSSEEFSFFAAKFHQAERRPEQAWQSYTQALGAMRNQLVTGGRGAGSANTLFFTPATVSDIGATLAAAGRLTNGASYLAELAQELEGIERSVAYAWRGRLLRASGNIPAALDSLAQALALEPDDEALRLLLLSTALQGPPRRALRVVQEQAPEVRNMERLSQLLSGALVRFVANSDWDTVWNIYMTLENGVVHGVGAESVRAQYAFVIAVASLRENFRPVGQPTGDRTVLARELLERAHSLSRGYYGLLSGAILHPGQFLSSAARLSENGGSVLSGGAAGAWDDYTHGFLRFGLVEEAYHALLQDPAGIRHETSVQVSEALKEQGLYLESIRAATRLRFQPNYTPHVRGEQRAFPHLFRDEVNEVVELYELDIDVFYALLREESHFAPAIVSHAGAVGLSQLMPATAADVAARLRLQNPDLNDPSTNLTIGAYYLSGLIDRFPTIMHALLAYNAGQGRVRSWMNTRSFTSDFYFHEAVPFLETRDYIRKILVSAVHYGELYHARPASETIQVIFPEIKELAELLQTR
ncbi:MAG: hypothetical protein EA428_06790 [Spirochaetaceae bacterium]|nr:MAG: hypothetical protein EA428_06790 [Spirochaetaceae bacterium]